MRPDLVRKTIHNWEPFELVKEHRFFFVKNLSKAPCYVAFEPNALEEQSIKVLGGVGEEVSLCFSPLYDARKIRFKTLYIKGDGEIELQGMENWVD